MQTRTIRSARHLLPVCLIAATAWILTNALSAQAQRNSGRDRVNGHDAESGEVLVKYRAGHTPDERAQHNAVVDADQDEAVGNGRIRRVHSRRFDAATLVSYFQDKPDVEYAEPNYTLYAIQTPNDPSFGQLWGLLNTGQVVGVAGTPGADIDATLAWNITTGSTATVVGVVDTGVDYDHPDLSANIWSAPSAFTAIIGGVNIPCPAGSHGFNALTNSCDPKDDHNHGSHVSGTIGARGNDGVGVAGVNWTASIMGLKFLNSGGSGSTSGAINAIEFAIQAKQIFGAGANVRVLSNSWGGGGFSQALLDEINTANASNMLFVAAAGNSNSDNDATPFYPSNYNAANLIAVAATDNQDARASFSNYGATTVDLGAPGVNILSTTRNNTYSYYNGTSMATPHVSGTAALLLSVCALDTAALKATILNNVDPIASMTGKTVTGGRLNVNNALAACNGAPSVPPAPTGLTATAGNAKVTLNWNASASATSYNIKRSTTSGSESNLWSSASIGYTDSNVTNGVTYYYVVTAVTGALESGNSNEASAKPTAPPAAPPAPNLLSATGGKRKISLQWSASSGATSYRVKRSTTNGGPYSIVATVTGTSYTNTGLAGHTTYYYVVSAVNAGGESPNSNQRSATTQ